MMQTTLDMGRMIHENETRFHDWEPPMKSLHPVNASTLVLAISLLTVPARAGSAAGPGEEARPESALALRGRVTDPPPGFLPPPPRVHLPVDASVELELRLQPGVFTEQVTVVGTRLVGSAE